MPIPGIVPGSRDRPQYPSGCDAGSQRIITSDSSLTGKDLGIMGATMFSFDKTLCNNQDLGKCDSYYLALSICKIQTMRIGGLPLLDGC